MTKLALPSAAILPTAAITTIVPLQPGRSVVHPQRKMPPKTSVRRAGDYRPTMNRTALEATSPLSRLSLVGSTTMARSRLLAPAATGGRLPRAIATASTTWATMVVAYVSASPASSSGSRRGASALVSRLVPFSRLQRRACAATWGRWCLGAGKAKSNAKKSVALSRSQY